jgi:cytochrome P450
VAAFLTPAKVTAVGPRIRELTTRRAGMAAARLDRGTVDTVDLAAEIADRVPAVIMAELLAIDLPDLPNLKRWSRDSLELFWGWPEPTRQIELAQSAAEFYASLSARVHADRASANLFGVLHRAGLSPEEVCSLGYFLLIAGHETTSQLISIGLHRALSEPATWQSLCDAQQAGAFVGGLLGSRSSVHTWRRVATKDTAIGADRLPAGAEVLLELTGHGAPQEYRLAFGHGIHRCLGANLAELETRIVLQTTAQVLRDVIPAGAEPEWLELLSFRAPRTVLVRRASR